MREIKFRGKRKNGEWVYGYLIFMNNKIAYIADMGIVKFDDDEKIKKYILNIEEPYNLGKIYKVIPETVGQFTGIKDKNGIEIYEGDILMRDRKTIFTPHAEPQIALVYYDINKARFWVKDKNIDLKFFDMRELNDFEKIGNVFDNPELLGN